MRTVVTRRVTQHHGAQIALPVPGRRMWSVKNVFAHVGNVEARYVRLLSWGVERVSLASANCVM